jgi:hypothetical protein
MFQLLEMPLFPVLPRVYFLMPFGNLIFDACIYNMFTGMLICVSFEIIAAGV